MSQLLQDARIAVRSLRRSRGFSAIVLLTVALGVGATTSIFSVVHGVLLLPPAYPGAERMVYSPRLQEGTGGLQYYWSHLNYRDVRDRAESFELLEGVRLGSVVVTGREGAERFFVRYVTPRFLEMYAARPALGRMLGPEDDRVPGGHPVVLITHKIWQSYFGGAPDVIGTSVNLSGVPYTVIGVLNPEFSYPFGQDLGSEVDLWVPAMMAGEAHSRGRALFADRSARAFSIIGRLKPEITIEQGQAEVDRLAAQLAQEHPESNDGWGIHLISWPRSKTNRVRGPLIVLMTGAAILLLIGCFNVANLMLVRGAGRHRELAIRLALGAGRRGLIRYLTVEAFVLALAGGALGIVIAIAGLPWLLRIVDGTLRVYATQLPPSAQIGINGTVLLAALGASVLSGVIFGVLPAFRASNVDLRMPLSGSERHGADRTGTRLRGTLVVFEIATATVLLASSSLLMRSLHEFRQVDLGFETARTLTFRVNIPASKYPTTDALARVAEQIRARIAASPETEWATPWGPGVPGVSSGSESVIPEGTVVQQMADAPQGRVHFIGVGALERLGITLREGREFAEIDRLKSLPVAVVSASLAKRLWPNRNALGRRFHPFATSGDKTMWTVVGVADDASMGGLMSVLGGVETPDDVYFPYAQRPLQEPFFLVRGAAVPSLAAVRDAVHAVDPNIPLYEIASIEEYTRRQTGPMRFASILMGAFAVAALFLAAIGVYGVLAFTVTMRSHEIGLRTALGAATGDTLRLFVIQGVRLAGLGVIVGIAGAVALGRVMGSLVVGVSGMDVLAVSSAAVLLITVALAACIIPARRATRIAPIVALQE